MAIATTILARPIRAAITPKIMLIMLSTEIIREYRMGNVVASVADGVVKLAWLKFEEASDTGQVLAEHTHVQNAFGFWL